jgi:hypothetical protein
VQIEVIVSALNPVQAGQLALEMARRSQGWDRANVLRAVSLGGNQWRVSLFVSRESGRPM